MRLNDFQQNDRWDSYFLTKDILLITTDNHLNEKLQLKAFILCQSSELYCFECVCICLPLLIVQVTRLNKCENAYSCQQLRRMVECCRISSPNIVLKSIGLPCTHIPWRKCPALLYTPLIAMEMRSHVTPIISWSGWGQSVWTSVGKCRSLFTSRYL